MKLLVPLVLMVVGVAGGGAAGHFLYTPPPPPEIPDEDVEVAVAAPDTTGEDFVKLSNQFVVPVVKDGTVTSLVVLSLSLEIAPGFAETIYELEPRIRDGFLQVLFDHANVGGFDGTFTDTNSLAVLRRSLMEAAQILVGPEVQAVLIEQIDRQNI